MKKQKLQLIILLVLLLLCAGVYFVLRNQDFETQEETAETVVWDIEKDNVTGFAVSGLYNYHFEKREDQWVETGMEQEDIEDATVNTLVSQLCSITTSETVIESPENLSDYGLDAPALTVELSLEDGSKKTIKIGNYLDMVAKYYIQAEGDENVYLISSYKVTDLQRDAESFIVVEEETETETETL